LEYQGHPGKPDRKRLPSKRRLFQIINRGKCSIISASDDWYYFRIKRSYWSCESLDSPFPPDVYIVLVHLRTDQC